MNIHTQTLHKTQSKEEPVLLTWAAQGFLGRYTFVAGGAEGGA